MQCSLTSSSGKGDISGWGVSQGGSLAMDSTVDNASSNNYTNNLFNKIMKIAWPGSSTTLTLYLSRFSKATLLFFTDWLGSESVIASTLVGLFGFWKCGDSIRLKSRFLLPSTQSFEQVSYQPRNNGPQSDNYRAQNGPLDRPTYLSSSSPGQPISCASEGPSGREIDSPHPCRCCYSQQRHSASPSSTMCLRSPS